ncbi:SURF1 family protein [Fulvimarina sp. MAC3]|uniref:SURF1 family protein n=1 Tax=Fulvimarina sp. MAC3 TaxID=3148887 RepID=UPI0031FC3803
MTDKTDAMEGPRGPRRPGRRRTRFWVILGCVSAVLFTIFVSLGIWQVERRAWKLELIAAVEERATAVPVNAPGPNQWASLSFEADEYRHVAVTGEFVKGSDALVQATTDYGFGYWLMTPLETGRGFTVFVNRGFVPSRDLAGSIEPPAGDVTLAGLLRMSQPGGAFLRSNDPVSGRWYSRDIAAIAETEGISGPVAPYFIDVEGMAETVPSGSNPSYPVGGLTVTQFRNSHLSYALTWFALAGLTLLGTAIVVKRFGAWTNRRDS